MQSASRALCGIGIRVVIWDVVVHRAKAIGMALFATKVATGGQFHDSRRRVVGSVESIPATILLKWRKSTFAPASVISVIATDLACPGTIVLKDVYARSLPNVWTRIDHLN